MCKNCEMAGADAAKVLRDPHVQQGQTQPAMERAFNAESGQPNARVLIQHRIREYRRTADALEALLSSIPDVLPTGAERGLLELCIHPPR